jgi:hypothetical protein
MDLVDNVDMQDKDMVNRTKQKLLSKFQDSLKQAGIKDKKVVKGQKGKKADVEPEKKLKLKKGPKIAPPKK